MVSRKHKQTPFPGRRISEAFLDFAAPVVSMTDENPSRQLIEEGLKIAFTVWNAVVLDTVNGNDHYLQMIHEVTLDDPTAQAVVDELIARKRALFGDDQRLIGEYKLTYKNGKLHLWAEARDPRSPPSNKG